MSVIGSVLDPAETATAPGVRAAPALLRSTTARANPSAVGLGLRQPANPDCLDRRAGARRAWDWPPTGGCGQRGYARDTVNPMIDLDVASLTAKLLFCQSFRVRDAFCRWGPLVRLRQRRRCICWASATAGALKSL